MVPDIDEAICTGCGAVRSRLRVPRSAGPPGRPLLLPELCHGCGVCAYVCPEEAISQGSREIGVRRCGLVEGVYFRWGQSERGRGAVDSGHPGGQEPDRGLRRWISSSSTLLPESRAPRSRRWGADYAVLVTEPTPFGLHDLRLAVETARELGIPCGVVINRAGIGDSRVNDFCAARRHAHPAGDPGRPAHRRGLLARRDASAGADAEARCRSASSGHTCAPWPAAASIGAVAHGERSRRGGRPMSAGVRRRRSLKAAGGAQRQGGHGQDQPRGCLAALATDKVLADCDVDAADLHLVLDPPAQAAEPFMSGQRGPHRRRSAAAHAATAVSTAVSTPSAGAGERTAETAA